MRLGLVAAVKRGLWTRASQPGFELIPSRNRSQPMVGAAQVSSTNQNPCCAGLSLPIRKSLLKRADAWGPGCGRRRIQIQVTLQSPSHLRACGNAVVPCDGP